MRAIYKYVQFLLNNGDTKFRNALVDSIKSLDWTTFNCKIISNSKFDIIEIMNLRKYNLPSFIHIKS